MRPLNDTLIVAYIDAAYGVVNWRVEMRPNIVLGGAMLDAYHS